MFVVRNAQSQYIAPPPNFYTPTRVQLGKRTTETSIHPEHTLKTVELLFRSWGVWRTSTSTTDSLRTTTALIRSRRSFSFNPHPQPPQPESEEQNTT